LSKKVYLVGGAVRDIIMGNKPNDFDFVVVGSTPEEMEAEGYVCVGGAFPVFLNDVGDEYALARTEYKDGAGYKGFKVAFGPDVTLEEDLSRRDLTINAIAMKETVQNSHDGKDYYFDPFGGIDDIHNKVLRHTSDAFTDDPLRVIRLARFYSRYPGFTVHETTKELSKQVVKSDDFKTLSPERVGVELLKVLKHSPEPWKFFEFLAEIGGLEFYFPEIHALIGVPH
jgi:tRNA nucleotidyltransferase (CCA-adding enzyme)